MRGRRLALTVTAVLAAAAVGGQFLLPALAERKLRSDLGELGVVQSVEVRAFPALKLLWQHADLVAVRMSRASATGARLAEALARSAGVKRVTVEIGSVKVGPLRARRATVGKEGPVLRAQALVTAADLDAALPPGFDVRPLVSGDGRLVFEGTATALGGISVRAELLARDGRLLLTPNVPFGALLTLTLFDDSRVAVQDVRARVAGDRVEVRMDAELRDGK